MLKNPVTLFENAYVRLSHSQEQALFHHLYTKETRRMSAAEYKDFLVETVALGKKHKPKHIMLNSIDFDYIITPAEQDWIAKDILPILIELGVKKFATIVPEEVFALISLEQTLDEAHNAPYEMRYFRTEEQAFEWLAAL